jgi:hypothetical protein
METPLLDKLTGWIWKKKTPDAPQPAPPPTPTPAPTPTVVDYVKAWRLLKEIPFHKLGRVVSLSGVIIFFAISGVLAWLALVAKFMTGIAR